MIPKIIHQTFPTKHLPNALADNVDRLKAMNRGYDHRLYDDREIEDFIRTVYGKDMLNVYNLIDWSYGAARADLFRYLLVYELGGIYIDIKSSMSSPIAQSLRDDDEYLLAKWRNGIGEVHERAGMSGPMRRLEGGEFQQWHVIAAPRHPYLAAVIEAVVGNVTAYRPWFNGTGRRAVIRMTGPIAYTQAIEPIRTRHPHRRVRSEIDLGLVYTVISNSNAHRRIFPKHYSRHTHSLVRLSGTSRLAGSTYSIAKRLSLPLIETAETITKRVMFG